MTARPGISGDASTTCSSPISASPRSPTAPYHQDLLPDDAALERRQLAASVVQAWVFGGMGSWNDAWLPDDAAQREYERVSSSLYTTLLTALPAAVNGA